MNGQGPPIKPKFHQRARDVFNVDFEIAPMSANCKNSAWQPEERIEIIEFVNLGKDHTATQFRARRIHLAVVLVRVPAWKIFADVRPHAQQMSETAFVDRALKFQKAGMETKLVADHHNAAALSRFGD